jgi:hypothetical protein
VVESACFSLGTTVRSLHVQKSLLSTSGALFPFVGEAVTFATWYHFFEQVQSKRMSDLSSLVVIWPA